MQRGPIWSTEALPVVFSTQHLGNSAEGLSKLGAGMQLADSTKQL